MKRTLLMLVVCLGFALPVVAAADPISGRWEGTFNVTGTIVPFTMTLKLDGEKVTGAVACDHTGPGTIVEGVWTKDTLTLKVAFEKHESIALDGKIDHGKLTGEFKTEGFVATWEAQPVR